MEWFARDFDRPEYFDIYRNKEAEARDEGPALAAILALPPGALVLDLPCGWGRLDPYLRALGHKVVGGDLSQRNLQRRSAENPGHAARLDFRRLPFRSDCAEGVLCAYTSWGYFASEAENQRQLSEFARVLEPGGVLVLDLAGRGFLEKAIGLAPGGWYEVEEGGIRYRERVRWAPDKRRVLTDRAYRGTRFRHDIWIPSDGEVRAALRQAGFRLDQAWGGLRGEPWEPFAERWIYRAIKDSSASAAL